MNTLEAISVRYSCRKYKAEQIPEETLETILKAGMAAPVGSAAYDTLHITVVQKRELFEKINSEVTELIFKMIGKKMDKSFGAPVMIFISSRPAMMPGMEYANAACVLENMALAATALGIDNIIWGGASAAVAASDELKKELEIPEGFNPVLCLFLGYAVEKEAAKEHTISVNRMQ